MKKNKKKPTLLFYRPTLKSFYVYINYDGEKLLQGPSMRLLFLLLLFVSTLLSANNFNKGVDAYKMGDFATAVELWTPYAKDGNLKAQYSIATIYYEGKGVEQNYRKAMYWYQQAAEHEYAKAYAQIGIMYCKGEGVLKSYKTAAIYIQLAFDNGCKYAPDIWKKYKLWEYE